MPSTMNLFAYLAITLFTVASLVATSSWVVASCVCFGQICTLAVYVRALELQAANLKKVYQALKKSD